MSETMNSQIADRGYWVTGKLKPVATGLTGILAVLVALKAMSYGSPHAPTLNDHIFRLVIFASLTIWMTLTMGIRKRGMAAMIVLAFASFIELFVIPSRGEAIGTLASSNLGIVFAYSGLQFYWFRIASSDRSAEDAGVDAS